jgi:nitrogen regulatory protein PII
MGIRERLGILGVAVEVEKEVIQILVSSEQVDRVFERMYLAGKLDTPGMGIAYITRLDKAATYIPPEVLAKVSAG